MAIYRQIQILFWQDGFILELTPEDKYFFLYIMTNPRTTQCGIYELPKRMAEAETGYNRETIDRLIKRFQEYGKILYCEETREIMILNWMKYNFINSKNTICCINKELKEVKNKNFVNIIYKICSKRGYTVEEIFEGIPLNSEAIVKDRKEEIEINEEAIEDTEEKNQVINEIIKGIQDNEIYNNYSNKQFIYENNAAEGISSSFTDNNIKNQGLHSGLKGASKPLGEEETKEEIRKESSNKQKVIDNNNKNKLQHKSAKDNPNKILLEFNKNIRQATVRDIEKIIIWLKEFEEEVIIQAILQAVKYNAAHTGYVESVLKNWRTLGLFTMEKLKAYRSKGTQEKWENRCNADAYKYLD